MGEGEPRIAIVTPYGQNGGPGGVEVFNRLLKRALGDVEIIAAPEKNDRPWGWKLERVGAHHPYRALLAVRDLIHRHRALPFDLVISNGLYGWPPSLRRLRVPLVQIYHFTLAGLARKALARRDDRFTTGTVGAGFDRLAGYGKRVIAVSASVLSEVERHYGLHGEVIPNAVDTSLFCVRDQGEARRALGLPEEARIGLFVGRAEHAKGFDLVLRIAESMPDVLFVLLGPRTEPGLANIRSIPEVPHERMALWYASADFLFLPSRYEGMNLSVLEALACGRPIVVSEAAYPFAEEPDPYGIVVSGFEVAPWMSAIREILGRGTSPSPRDLIAATHSLELFRLRWRTLVQEMLREGSWT